MNFRKYLNSAALKADPLCGISTHKDTLNLNSGNCTRVIKKIIVSSDSSIVAPGDNLFYVLIDSNLSLSAGYCMASHYINNQVTNVNLQNGQIKQDYSSTYGGIIVIRDTAFSTSSEYKSWLSDQYNAGTPLTIWYGISSTTETISLPSGLSGTVKGYLIQDGTPTQEVPIYPTANTAKGWYNINAYKRSVLVWNNDMAYERESGAWT